METLQQFSKCIEILMFMHPTKRHPKLSRKDCRDETELAVLSSPLLSFAHLFNFSSILSKCTRHCDSNYSVTTVVVCSG